MLWTKSVTSRIVGRSAASSRRPRSREEKEPEVDQGDRDHDDRRHPVDDPAHALGQSDRLRQLHPARVGELQREAGEHEGEEARQQDHVLDRLEALEAPDPRAVAALAGVFSITWWSQMTMLWTAIPPITTSSRTT